ncbi:unnamed protein product [Rhizoctonia solani]|nr:unnamed protein product [Rhizoctonia solani]
MGRYIYPTVSPPLIPSDEEIIAGIVRADPTPPDVHIDPTQTAHGSISRLDHGDNEVDDIVACIVDSNCLSLVSLMVFVLACWVWDTLVLCVQGTVVRVERCNNRCSSLLNILVLERNHHF